MFLRFQEENTFWQKILSQVGNDQLSIHFRRLLDYLKSREFFAQESCSWAKIPLPKNLSRKIARFFVSKISPATGMRHGVEGDFNVNVDPINSLALSPRFLLDEVHLLHVNADATSLPASTLPWF